MTIRECIGLSKCKTEYITKEQALEAIKGKMWPGELEAAIKAIPAVDAAPVIYAQWSFAGETGHGFGMYLCSNCGSYVGEGNSGNFCPECGARMDGEDL